MTRIGALLCLLAGCSAPERARIVSPAAPAPIGPYSQALRVGEQIWCAGQIGIEPASGALAPGGIVPETRQALSNLAAVLAAANASLADVVSVHVFLADLDEFAAFNEEYARHFTGPAPARATVQVARLPKDARVELQAVAVRQR